MSKKWIIIIAAVVLILIIIPFGIILSVHLTHHDCSFEYAKVDDLVTEIANKHTYYSAKEKTVEIQMDQDMINSIIKDNLESMELDLPENFTVKEVVFDTKKQKVFINAKYGFLNLPLSANINVDLLDDGVEIYADKIMVAWLGAPGFITGQIPESSLRYTFKYSDMDIPSVFSVQDVKFGTGNLKVQIKLNQDEIVQYAIDLKKDVLNEIEDVKANNSEILASFIDKLLGGDTLSDAKIKEYIDAALNNEEIINSAVHFAVAGDLDKYANAFEDGRKTVEEWAKPLQVVKYYGNIDETVNTILYNQELKDFMTWFLPEDTIQEYSQTAEDYFGKYQGAMTSLNTVSANIENGNLEGAIDKILNDNNIKSFVTLFAAEEDIDEYLGEARSYYNKFEGGKAAFEKVFTSIDKGDLDTAVNTLSRDKNLKELVSLFMPKDDVDEYLGSIEDYYAKLDGGRDALEKALAGIDSGDLENTIDILSNDKNLKEMLSMFMASEDIDEFTGTIDEYYSQYNDIITSLDEAVVNIDIESLDQFVADTSAFLEDLKDDQKYLLEVVSDIDPIKVREIILYLEMDDGPAGRYIKNDIDPDYYSDFKKFVRNLEENKKTAQEFIEDIDFTRFDDYIEALEELKEVALLLKYMEYMEAIDALGEGSINKVLLAN